MTDNNSMRLVPLNVLARLSPPARRTHEGFVFAAHAFVIRRPGLRSMLGPGTTMVAPGAPIRIRRSALIVLARPGTDNEIVEEAARAPGQCSLPVYEIGPETASMISMGILASMAPLASGIGLAAAYRMT